MLFITASKAELEDAKTALRQEDWRTPAEVDVSVSVAQLEDDWKERCHHAETLASELHEAREGLRGADRCLSIYIYNTIALSTARVSGLQRGWCAVWRHCDAGTWTTTVHGKAVRWKGIMKDWFGFSPKEESFSEPSSVPRAHTEDGVAGGSRWFQGQQASLQGHKRGYSRPADSVFFGKI